MTHRPPRTFGVSGILLALLIVGTLPAWAGASDLSGRWRGELPFGDPPIEVILVFQPGEPPTAVASSVSHPDLDLRVVELEIEGEEIRFSLEGLPENASFRGRLGEEGARIEGELSHSPDPVPETDIHLVEFDPTSWEVVSARNVTDRAGYDNQPHFLPDAGAFLYTSQRDGQTDIYRYDPGDASVSRVTRTPDTSEYSPTPLPGGGGFSTVRVEEDGTQRLWAFDPDGTNPRLLLARVKPVGYHAWLDAKTVALFVLGSPHMLQIADLETGRARKVADGIGRGLRRVPDGRAVTYVHKQSEDDWKIRNLDPRTGSDEIIVAAVDGSEDFAYLPDGRLVTGQGGSLMVCRPDTGGWELLMDLRAHGIDGITRIATHPAGRFLAVVGERPPGPEPEPARDPVTFDREPSP